MLKLNWQLPNYVDTSNPQALQMFLNDLRMVIEDIILKAQQTQMEVRSSTPDTNSIEEGEVVPSVESGTYKIYRKINGQVKSVTMT